MASLQDIRRRIRSVRSTQQVTKAMKMISAVKLRKSQERLLAMRPYATKLQEVVSAVVSRYGSEGPLPRSAMGRAFLNPREEKRLRVVVVASDRGFCGGFNTNLLKQTDLFLLEHQGQVTHLDVIGKRASDWARQLRLKTSSERLALALDAFPKAAREIAAEAARQYEAGEIDALYMVYNYFNSPVSQTPTALKLFPVPPEPRAAVRAEASHLLEPDPDTVLEALLPCFIETELLRALLESSAAEHGARMSAMDKASSNAQEMIDKLTLNMNKLRQASITNQIIEIVSGANA